MSHCPVVPCSKDRIHFSLRCTARYDTVLWGNARYCEPSLSLVKDKQLPLQLWLRMLPFQWQNKQIVIILAYIAQRHTNEWGIYTEPVVKPVWCIIRQECVLSRACMCRTYKKRELKKFWIDNQQTELKKWSHVWGLAVAVIPLSLSLLSLFSSLSLSLSLSSLSLCVCVCVDTGVGFSPPRELRRNISLPLLASRRMGGRCYWRLSPHQASTLSML